MVVASRLIATQELSSNKDLSLQATTAAIVFTTSLLASAEKKVSYWHDLIKTL